MIATTKLPPWQLPLLDRACRLQRQGQLPHALMIDTAASGDTLGLILQMAQRLLCRTPRDGAPCGDCEACRLLAAGTYADFSIVTLEPDEKTRKPGKNIRIEQIRDLIYELGLTRNRGELKLAAIYPAERMNTASANALLKTLEEPPAGVLLLLVTHNPGRVPVTVRSRCQQWSVPLPDRDTALAWLADASVPAEQASTYLDYARGDPVLALELAEREYADMVVDFRQGFAGLLRNQQSVAALAVKLLRFDHDLVRRLVDMTLRAYCLQMSGLASDGSSQGDADPVRAQALHRLYAVAGQQLQTDENNLDFQLQLEDVLISLKQILGRRPN